MTGEEVPLLLCDAPVPGFADLLPAARVVDGICFAVPSANGLDPRAVQALAVVRASHRVAAGRAGGGLRRDCEWLVGASRKAAERWLLRGVRVRVHECLLVSGDPRRCERHPQTQADRVVAALLDEQVFCAVGERPKWELDLRRSTFQEPEPLLLAAVTVTERLQAAARDGVWGRDAWLRATGRASDRVPSPLAEREPDRSRGLHWYGRWKRSERHGERFLDCPCGGVDEVVPCRTCVRERRLGREFDQLSARLQLEQMPVLLWSHS
jgi:hypothetical protein